MTDAELRAEHQRLKDAVVETRMVVWHHETAEEGDIAADNIWQVSANACAALAAFEAQHPEVR